MTTTTPTPTSQAIEKAKQPGLVEQYRNDFALVLPSHIKADQWVRVAQGLLRRNRQLARVAQQNPGSFLSAMLRCAHLGLEPGDTFHLVPFGSEIVGITDYTGEIELIYRAGEVATITAEIVRQGDVFIWQAGALDTQQPPRWPGPMERPYHEVDWFGKRGDMIGAYAYAVMRSGAISRVVVMNRDQIDEVKAVSKTAKKADSPWQQWPDRMWLKTVVKQLAKWVPSSAEYREQLLRSTSTLEEVAPRLGAELPDPRRVDDDDIIDGEVIDDTDDQADEPDGGAGAGDGGAAAAGEDDEAERKRAQRALMAQTRKAFPDDPTDQRDAKRHAIAYVALNGRHVSSNDMTADELRKAAVMLRDVEEGRVTITASETGWTVQFGDNVVEVPPEPEAA